MFRIICCRPTIQWKMRIIKDITFCVESARFRWRTKIFDKYLKTAIFAGGITDGVGLLYLFRSYVHYAAQTDNECKRFIETPNWQLFFVLRAKTTKNTRPVEHRNDEESNDPKSTSLSGSSRTQCLRDMHFCANSMNTLEEKEPSYFSVSGRKVQNMF